MSENKNCGFFITTGLRRALNIHNRMRYMENKDEFSSFLRNMYMEFNIPSYSEARLYCERDVPVPEWFVLFDENEKSIQTDEKEYLLGIYYCTTIGLAISRISRLMEMANKGDSKIKKNMISLFYLNSALGVLKLFNENDLITMYFVYPDWPNSKGAENNNYVRQFELQILGYTKEIS